MSDAFRDALAVVLRHEGGYVNDPADPGGATNFGVSLRWLRGLGDLDGDGFLEGDLDHDGDVDAEDIRSMDQAEAAALYRLQWWDRYGYGRLPAPLAIKQMDLAVNMGHVQATRCLQRALVRSGVPSVTVDGQLGPKTIAASAQVPTDVALAYFRDEAARFYKGLIAKKPAFAKFEKGWLRRAAA